MSNLVLSTGFCHFEAPEYEILIFSGLWVWDFDIFRPQVVGIWYFLSRWHVVLQYL